MQRKAFTLIELLVVIAIIAILAAILFPVFAQAKLAAKKASSLSNIKQIALAQLMYTNDFDDTLTPFVNGAYSILASGPFTTEVDTWVWTTQPYIKSIKLDLDPMTTDSSNIFGSGNYAWWRNQDLFPFFGINYAFLTPWTVVNNQCAGGFGAKTTSGGSQPANTVLLTQSWDFSPTATLGYFTATAPGAFSALLPSPNYCAWSGSGWSQHPGGVANAKPQTAEIAYRDGQGSNVAWLDGHAKYQTLGALAAGTDWAIQTDPNATKIVDMTKYVWSYDGTIPQ